MKRNKNIKKRGGGGGRRSEMKVRGWRKRKEL